ncbi:MAG: RNA polymerase sigma factor [Solirubrobacteraceae bacterium]
MATVDSLPRDQRAVLQLVLGRGRSYGEIARLLTIKPEAVRERALAALDALGPQTKLDGESRAQISDYLLRQLPDDQLEGVRDRLAQSASERAWARVLSSELAPLAAGAMPEIPLETTGSRPQQPAAAPEAAAAPAPPAPAGSAPDSVSAAAPQPSGSASEKRRGRRQREPRPPREPKRSARSPDSAAGPRSSRVGGLVVIAVAVLIVVVVLVIVLGSGGSKHKTAAISPTTTSTSNTTSTTLATSTTSTTAAKVLRQINLTPTAAGSKAAGIAEVLKEGSSNGVAIVAQNMTANSTKPPNAYAVWLYNSATDAKILGFVNPGVGSTGKLSTAGALPANASHYKQLVVTLESSGSPKKPGAIVLQGTFTGA